MLSEVCEDIKIGLDAFKILKYLKIVTWASQIPTRVPPAAEATRERRPGRAGQPAAGASS